MLYFDKDSLKSQDYDFEREILLTNSQGGYTSTTLCGCNTRKYHGLVVSPIEKFGWRRHVLMATMIEQVETCGRIFELSTLTAVLALDEIPELSEEFNAKRAPAIIIKQTTAVTEIIKSFLLSFGSDAELTEEDLT